MEDGKAKVKTEVPIYFKKDGTEILGRIDRLIIRSDSVDIIDYKKGEEEKKYIQQMQNYREGLSKIYPNKEIKCYFLWLDNPRGKRIERIL